MRILIAGATGVLGRQAAPRLAEAGHEVIGLSRSADEADAESLIRADLLDPDRLSTAVSSAAPDVVVHLATALPDPIDPRHVDRDMAATNRLRSEGSANLVAAARAAGVERIIAQGYAPAYDPSGPEVCDEDQPLWRDPPRRYAATVAALRELERLVTDAGGLVLRFGHLYGPGTTYAADGATVGQIRKGKLPVVGAGSAVFSFTHAADAGAAIEAAVASDARGVLNVVDDAPAPVREWLPELARLLGAPGPKHVPTWMARLAAGPFGVAFMTQLRGADNRRARERLGFRPEHSSWRDGFAAELGPVAQAA
jgi:nucleoside-diphosphate-sugar epimerase